MSEILTTEEMLKNLNDSLKKGDFKADPEQVDKEDKPFWIKGREDGQKYMKEAHVMEKVVNDASLQRLRGVVPEDAVVKEYIYKAGIDMDNQEQVDAYVLGFFSACEQGWPPLDH